MDPLYIGIFGSSFFIIAWAYELYEEIFKHHLYTDFKFACLNIIGISAMLVYAYLTSSMLFFYLNTTLLFFVGIEITISLYLIHKKRKRSK